MIAPGDNAQASSDAESARADFCGPPRTGPALGTVPLRGTLKHASPAPSPGRAEAATPFPLAAPPPATPRPRARGLAIAPLQPANRAGLLSLGQAFHH